MSLPDDYLEQLKQFMPERSGTHGWHIVRTLVPRLFFQHGMSWERIKLGTLNYRKHCDKEQKTGTDFVHPAQRFYSDMTMFVDEWADKTPPKSAAEIRSERRWAELKEQAARVEFRPPHEHESADVYETQLKFAGREKPRDMGVVTQLVQAKRA